jgi:hypothetical protein
VRLPPDIRDALAQVEESAKGWTEAVYEKQGIEFVNIERLCQHNRICFEGFGLFE